MIHRSLNIIQRKNMLQKSKKLRMIFQNGINKEWRSLTRIEFKIINNKFHLQITYKGSNSFRAIIIYKMVLNSKLNKGEITQLIKPITTTITIITIHTNSQVTIDKTRDFPLHGITIDLAKKLQLHKKQILEQVYSL